LENNEIKEELTREIERKKWKLIMRAVCS